MLHAVVHQGIDLVGLVEHRIHTQLRTAHAHIRRGVVAQHHHLLPRPTRTASRQHTQPAALPQEQIDDGQVPFLGVGGQPVRALVFRFCHAHCFHRRQLLQGPDQVLADGGVVFNNVGAQFHGRVHLYGQCRSRCPSLEFKASVRRILPATARWPCRKSPTAQHIPDSRHGAAPAWCSTPWPGRPA